MIALTSTFYFAISGIAFIAIPEALSLLILSVGLIALTGILRWIFSKFDAVDNAADNEAK